jgi:hypothetical protein
LGVEADSSFAEHRLADLHLPDEGVLVLGIRQEDGTFLGAPRGDTAIHEQDTLVVYGYADVLEGLGMRRVGMEGDRAHTEPMSEIAARQAEEAAVDPEPPTPPHVIGWSMRVPMFAVGFIGDVLLRLPR